MGQRLPTPTFTVGDEGAAIEWVSVNLASLFSGSPTHSDVFTGGQSRADAALAGFDVAGYAARRNEVWPPSRRRASMLSPYIRHGLLTLPRVWHHVGGGPSTDVTKFRDELLWQEYARHLYARLGSHTARPLRFEVAANPQGEQGWQRGDDSVEAQMACWQLLVDELDGSGWLPNQTRMWFASHWSVRRGWDWRAGEDYFFARLLDGSRAANRLGWQWTVGAATGKPYGFSRWQVNKRAPGLCEGCAFNRSCPIEHWPDPPDVNRIEADPRLRRGGDPDVIAGPTVPVATGSDIDVVWLTAESLGDDDPALLGHPQAPAVFVFDEPLLARLHLAAPRLVFLVECLADLAQRRDVHVYRGTPADVLVGQRVAATFTPVPGWRRLAERIQPDAIHPWPWLRRPTAGPVSSFSAWRR